MERPQNNTEDVLKNLGLFPSCQLSWELTTGAHLLIHSPQEIYIVVLSLTLTLVDIFTCGEIFVTAFENTVNLLQQKVPNCRPANKHVAIQGSRGWRGGGGLRIRNGITIAIKQLQYSSVAKLSPSFHQAAIELNPSHQSVFDKLTQVQAKMFIIIVPTFAQIIQPKVDATQDKLRPTIKLLNLDHCMYAEQIVTFTSKNIKRQTMAHKTLQLGICTMQTSERHFTNFLTLCLL